MQKNILFKNQFNQNHLRFIFCVSLLLPTTSFLADGTADCNVGAGTSSTECGVNSFSNGNNSTSVGSPSSTNGVESVAIGSVASANSNGQISIGSGANSGFSPGTFGSPESIAIGHNSFIESNSPGAIAIGGNIDAIAFGAHATAPGAIALGADVINDVPNSMLINVPLRIEGSDNQLLLLENTSGTNGTRRLMKMVNLGPVGFEMEDTNLGDIWQFRSDNTGKFIANKLGNIGAEFSVDGDGNARFLGEVRANGILLTSSRESKTDISSIKSSEVMKKLKQIEIAEWRYKKSDINDRHISPMAEDFYSLFKLGRDGKSINPNDLASVAIVAAKELQKRADSANLETTALKAENVVLKKQLKEQVILLSAKNDALQKRLTSLEKLVTNLAFSNNQFPETGAKVVLMK